MDAASWMNYGFRFKSEMRTRAPLGVAAALVSHIETVAMSLGVTDIYSLTD